ncbi:hypothetical protein ACFYTF_29830 [Nocardia thailandica]|uniref:Uncharacterized protein n=1 Tax=Nocardia thailandica TaxID=257275 RepID=A0ABW6PX75_9NOCA
MPPVAAAGLMVLSVVLALHRGWVLTSLWLLALPVLAAAFVGLVVGFGIALWRAGGQRPRWPLATTIVLAAVGIGVPVLAVTSPEAGAWLRFHLERPAFAAVAAADPPPASDGLYGRPLPGHLCWVSANCRVADLGSAARPVRFVPDFVGIPDGATGYGYFTGAPGPGPFDGFGDPICPRVELADGWWWLGGCP